TQHSAITDTFSLHHARDESEKSLIVLLKTILPKIEEELHRAQYTQAHIFFYYTMPFSSFLLY
ncbi:MAG: hypothetical protein ACRCV3_03025, partial [Desulfovibrionaceae bacterium]